MSSPTPPSRPMPGLPSRRNKVVSAAEAVALIRDGDTVATCGFVGTGFAENLAVALSAGSWRPGAPGT